MTWAIEDYGLIGDLQTAGLVSRDATIDWLCFPRFDSGACFAALLGDEENGRWAMQPVSGWRSLSRRYWQETLVLETVFETDDGLVRVIDFMPPRGEAPDVVRIVEALTGTVRMRSELVIRFDYGSIVPWVRNVDGTRLAIAGPDAVAFRTPVPLRGENMRTVGEFDVAEGERVPFVLTWYRSHEDPPRAIDAEHALRDTEDFWRDWAAQCEHMHEWHDDVHRSLLTLKALTYAPTGGIVAAPTASLPERIGGPRNWDYRFCWLRDATLMLLAMLHAGYTDEARRWRTWLLRAVAGDPADLQIMYGVAGERRLMEWEADWLPGYRGSSPVRIGNAASDQLQLDVYGEVIDTLFQGREHGLEPLTEAWSLVVKMLEWLETGWRQPDEGIWEVRGPRRHFTHSKVMAWVAFDRGIKLVEVFEREGPVARWRELRDEIHDEVCRKGFDPERGAFVQSYGSKDLDASLLLVPLVGFLPPDDPRVIGTVAAIERELTRDGFVERYETAESERNAVDGIHGDEGVFLPCSFWLVDNLFLQGREDEARALFERLLSLRNDLGLISEEYDPVQGCMLGNFPQAFTHLALVNSAFALSGHVHPSVRHGTV
jgi:GH15 family glucan-1,4-alpha-glucosidase